MGLLDMLVGVGDKVRAWIRRWLTQLYNMASVKTKDFQVPQHDSLTISEVWEEAEQLLLGEKG